MDSRVRGFKSRPSAFQAASFRIVADLGFGGKFEIERNRQVLAGNLIFENGKLANENLACVGVSFDRISFRFAGFVILKVFEICRREI